MSTPGYLSNSALAAQLGGFINRWNLRENQMIALISQPNGTVIVTDGLGNDHELSSFPQWQQDVQALIAPLGSGITSIAEVQGHADAAQAAASTAQDAAQAATAAKNTANAAKNAANTSKAASATSAANAATSASNAATSATAAAHSKTAAETARDVAQGYADQVETILTSAGNVVSVAGKTGAVTLTTTDITGLQPALDSKLNLTGGTLTNSLTVEGAVRSKGADNYNASYYLRDASNSNRGVLMFNRAEDRLELRRYTTEGSTQGRFYLDATGASCTSSGLISTNWAVIRTTPTASAALWLRDADDANHGMLGWNRSLDAVQLQRRNPETGVTQGEIRIKNDGNVHIYGAVSATGGFNGKATSADKLHTSPTINGTAFNGTANIITARWGAERTLNIGDTGKTVNGTGNVTWTLNEIGAAPTSHTHTSAEIVETKRAARFFFNQL